MMLGIYTLYGKLNDTLLSFIDYASKWVIYSASIVFLVLSPVVVAWERLLKEYWLLVCLNFSFVAEKPNIPF